MKKLLTLTLTFLLISGICFAREITFAWDANNEIDLAGYKIYQGYSHRKYGYCYELNTDTTFTINLTDSVYYFAVTAYDSTGEESLYSDEIVLYLYEIPRPKKVQNFKIIKLKDLIE